MNKAEIFRNKINAAGIIELVGAHDGFSATLIEDSGFDGIWASSLEISASYGVPDEDILAYTEYLDTAARINRVTSLPVIADVGNGFINQVDFGMLVTEYENAGIAGICVEDKINKVNSFSEKLQQLQPQDEFCKMLRSGLYAKRSESFTIIARTEALIAGDSIESALERTYAYEQAGADMILIHSRSSSGNEIMEFARRWRGEKHLVVVPTTYYNLDRSTFSESGIKVIVYANQNIRSRYVSFKKVLSDLKRSGSGAININKLSSIEDIFSLQEKGLSTWKKNLSQ